MAKAILIMDMPEQVCQKCTLCYETENDDEYLCCATGKLVPDGEKPDWCPLRELPEEKESDPVMDCDIDFGICSVMNWNNSPKKGEASKANPTGRVMKKNLCKKVISF